MNKKIRVGLLFGGRSAEHEVSLQSAKNVMAAIDKEKYEVTLIGVDKKGRWHLHDAGKFLLNSNDPKLIKLNGRSGSIALVPGGHSQKLVSVSGSPTVEPVDVFFPILHGPYGEDGTIQGLMKLAGVPFVGAGILGSAVSMDKDVMKRLLREAGIPTAKFLVVAISSQWEIDFEQVRVALGMPFFVKPANLGSSVGIKKVHSEAEFRPAIDEAFQYDKKILIEEYVGGREIECSVLGNEDPVASVPGEVLPKHEFYSYEAKYIDEHGAALEIPANLPGDVVSKIQQLAIKTFKVLCCYGMARVDFFLNDDNRLIVNELNTIPGFTQISMFPKLWEESGVSYSELIDRLITLALERFEKESRIKISL